MRLQFLGTGGYHPNSRRHTACIHLPELGVVFDAGTSFFRLPERLEQPEIDIFLTHAHLDHIAGLTFFLVPLIDGTVKRATIHATQPVLDAVRQHLFNPAIFPLVPDFEFQVLRDEESIPGNGRLTSIALRHPGGSRGYKIVWPDRSLAYITDTTANDSYLDFIRGVDVLIHECYFPDEMAEWSLKTGHSNTTPVVELARAAGVGQLWLVHIDPQRPDDDPIGIATARAIFPATKIAEDLLEIEF